VQLCSLALRIPLGILIPDSSIKGSLKTPRVMSPEKITLIQREGSKPSLTVTLLQSSQLQPFNLRMEVSGPVMFLKLSFRLISEHFRFFIRQLPTWQGSWADQHYSLLTQQYGMKIIEVELLRANRKRREVFQELQAHSQPFY